jgi:ribosomal protein L40E
LRGFGCRFSAERPKLRNKSVASTWKREANTKSCLACGSSIPVQAQKCAHCGALQDWRRYFGFLSVQLGALAAAVAVVTGMTPVFTNLLHHPDSDVSIGRTLVTRDADLDIRLVNSGDRDAELLLAEIRLKTTDAQVETGEIELSGPPDYMPISLISAHSSYDLSGIPRESFPSLKQFAHDHKNTLSTCSLVIHISNFQSGDQSLKRDLGCTVFATALKTARAPGRR